MTDWMEQAACKGVDPSVFYSDTPGIDGSLLAKRICGSCPVKDQCLDYALDTGELFGVWGGKTPRQRQRLRIGRPRPCEVCRARFQPDEFRLYCSRACWREARRRSELASRKRRGLVAG